MWKFLLPIKNFFNSLIDWSRNYVEMSIFVIKCFEPIELKESLELVK